MKPVHFLQSGVPYGYGYNAGENGQIKEADFERLDALGIVAEIVLWKPSETREKAVKQKYEKR
jgi:hypothetical protein